MKKLILILYALYSIAVFASEKKVAEKISEKVTTGQIVKSKTVVSSYEKLPTPKKGGTIQDTLSNNPKVMNPLLSSDANSGAVEGYFWATLFTEDSETLQPLPYLASSYEVSADKKSYTFVLNKNAKWQDDTPVTTADVQFTFETMMNPKTEAAAQRSYWEGVTFEKVDEFTFKFKNEVPKFDTLRQLYLFQTIQKKQFDGEADFNKAKGILNPVSNGPYILKSFLRDQKVELERNKNWWGNDIAHLKNRHNADLIVLKIITDQNLEYERFLKGDQDFYTFAGAGLEIYATKVKGVDKDKFADKPETSKLVWASEFKNKAPRGYTWVGWNLKNPLFESKKTRQALARLIDYKTIIDKTVFGYGYQSTSPFGSLTMNSDPGLRHSMLTFDSKAALKLLKEDGWADSNGDNILDKQVDGKRLDFKFTLKFNSNNTARAKIAQIIKENFKKAGIEIEVRSMEWNAYISDVDDRKFEAILLAWTATPYPNPKQTWHTDSEKEKGSNVGFYSNKKVDELIDKANLEFDLKKRSLILHEINRLIYDDQPYAFLYEPSSLIQGFNKKVKSSKWVMSYDVGAPTDIYQFVE